ncbi:MAG: hypothetical protein MJZ34_11945 [Paludibacteraceae bacterium]|nr:hypothetical protein [Paludibacteraceae bacterium]
MIYKKTITVFLLLLSSFRIFADEEVSYDYMLMKGQTSLIANNVSATQVSDSTLFFKSDEGYDFYVKILSYEFDIYKTHKLIVEVIPHKKASLSNGNIPFFFNFVCSKVLKFHDYMFIDEIGDLCELMKEKMIKPFDLLKNNVMLDDPYYDSCFSLFQDNNSYILSLEACNKDFPYESLTCSFFKDDKCVFMYSFTLP